MSLLYESLSAINKDAQREKQEVLREVLHSIEQGGYSIAEQDLSRPWGGFFRFPTSDADKFLTEFFPDLNADEARLGSDSIELSPKILVVSPEQRLSWQYHHRRSEVWRFLTKGAYKKSSTNAEPIDNMNAQEGELVIFGPNERHRLIGAVGRYTFVAEIWQHTVPTEPSDEEDIIRVQDDYRRN